ncbi:beta-N-acetylhexosaminidase [Gramella lutea]|uniref:beta-N-acetylhexosaminidase n=1 Tax=Christiangramia lutea TaxID=1607951 RepID=A0A9X1V2G0_9FLAO|nr:beta-N-acetylhexosaminidase [Christiangramia lutea]MCH4822456.1 beta-N-acetylhexosaminidase [Christiangramia lutea]
MISNFTKYLICLGIALSLNLSGFGMQNSEETPSIIPMPQTLNWESGSYSIPNKNIICFNETAASSTKWIQKLLQAAGTKTELKEGDNCGNWNLQVDAGLKTDLGEEGYQLVINSSGISIKSATEAGMFYGIQTLRQMFPPEIESGKSYSSIKLKFVEITDNPAYSWRGSMLDVARSFLSKEYIKKHIDRMAFYKMNRLHLHLSDDQGWRIEIKKYPELTETGGKSAVKNGRSGFLTQKEYIELQEYAARRNIVIIPEIDMPGHVYAALASYPELNCDNNKNIEPKRATPPELYDGYNVGWTRLCLEDDKTYEFVENIIKELSEITTGKWIHIGGDEIEDPLYEEFIQKADAIVRKYEKSAIGWEESAKAELSDSFIVQRWNGETEIAKDQKIIDSFCKFFYLDHGNVQDQENTYKWCNKEGVSLEKVYSYNTNDKRVIGVEAPVWSELVISDDRADDRLWPRSIAMAEVAWTNAEKRNFQDFTERLAEHGLRMDELGINYFKSPEVKWRNTGEKGVFSEKLSNEEDE